MMTTKVLLSNILVFTAGAAIGSVVTWKIVKTKYEKIAQEEIESVKEVFSKITNENVFDEENSDETEDDISEEEAIEKEKEAYDELVHGAGYTNYSDIKQEEADNMDKPYVIEPEEFGECEYATVSLTYYEGDKVLTNEDNDIIDNVDELVGADFASHFGEYEEDSVFIRNDELEIDFEILKDYDSYYDDDNEE